jgi:WD40 repeat protein
LESVYVHCAGISPDRRAVVSGGMDGVVSVFAYNEQEAPGSFLGTLAEGDDAEGDDDDEKTQTQSGDDDSRNKPTSRLVGHKDVVSSVSFFSNTQQLQPNNAVPTIVTTCVTASGDKTCRLWDLSSEAAVRTFEGHAAEVLHVSTSRGSEIGDVFLSGSGDETIRLWDSRASKACVNVFQGHSADVNEVAWANREYVFASASVDATCALWDARKGRFKELSTPRVVSGYSSVAWCHDNSLVLCGAEDGTLLAFDALNCALVYTKQLDARIVKLAASAYGHGLAIVTGRKPHPSAITLWGYGACSQ